MRSIEPENIEEAARATEAKLRKEIEDLKRQLKEQKGTPHGTSHGAMWHPSGLTIAVIFLAMTAVLVAAFFAGYIPLQKRNALIRDQAQEQEQALPRAEVIQVGRSTRRSELQLPGNIQAVTEAPILARAEGYIKRRMVDIGDRVKAGEAIAEIEAPEVDQQIRQAKASLQQAQAGLEQAIANQQQGKANQEMSRVTADRWKNLASKGVVSRQENDQYQAQYQAQTANLEALEKAVAAARSNVGAAEANAARLDEVQSYRIVRAPFDGVVTLRNVDVGALVNAGSTLLFRIAQTGMLRTYVNVPQTNASSIRKGQQAQLTVSNLPGRRFTGTVARTANALDPTSRTMLVEVEVPNKDGALMPGMYAEVDLSNARPEAPLLIPDDALIVRSDGAEVAIVRADKTVHLEKIQVGRDYGDRLEVVGGSLQEGDTIIVNPGDAAREGLKVTTVPAHQK